MKTAMRTREVVCKPAHQKDRDLKSQEPNMSLFQELVCTILSPLTTEVQWKNWSIFRGTSRVQWQD